MILLLASVLSFFASPTSIMPYVVQFVDDVIPLYSQFITSNIESLFKYKMSFSWVGVLSLIFSAQMLFVNMEGVINHLLHSQKTRHFLITRLIFFLWLVGMVLILFTPFAFEILENLLTSFHIFIPYYSQLSSKSAFFIVTFIMYGFIMFMIPVHKLPWNKVVLGGLYFSFTLYLGKNLFRYFMEQSLDRYNIVYGSLSTIVVGLLWIFYFYLMFLFFVYWAGRFQDPVYQKRKGWVKEEG